MAKRGEYAPRRRQLLTPEHPDSVAAWVQRYLQALTVRGMSASTWSAQMRDLARFNEWCVERTLGSPREITKPILERFQRHLFYYRKRDGHPLTLQRQVVFLHHLRAFFRWLVRHNHLLHNPASDLELPRAPKTQLPDVLTVEEVETILAQFDVSDALGLRDRAIAEVLYSTGLRRMEVCGLTLFDVAWSQQTVHVRCGKGGRERIVPIGERALAWLRKYLDEARPVFVIDPSEMHLFLTQHGQPLPLERLTHMMREAKERAGIPKRGACHLFRHTAATLMLENGADVRYIQEMLGHANLATTQIYTHVSITKLRQIHAATHPGAKLTRRLDPDTPLEDA